MTHTEQTTKEQYIQRFAQLREELVAHNLHALLVPMDDEHLNEYVLDGAKRLEWLTGFTGSAGEGLLTRDNFYLFVDSRYHTQGSQEMHGMPVEVVKLGLEGQLPLEVRIQALAGVHEGFAVGVDPFTISMLRFQKLQNLLSAQKGSLVATSENLMSKHWHDAPGLPDTAYELVPDDVAGASLAEKVQAVRTVLPERGILLVTKLDQVAWLLNLRGFDIPYNPVPRAYVIVTSEEVVFFGETAKLPEALRGAAGLRCLPYDDYAKTLQGLPADAVMVFDPEQITQGTLSLVAGRKACAMRVPTFTMKAIKNQAEQQAMKTANLQASRAKIRALAWLSRSLAAKESVSEKRFADVIEGFYAEEPNYRGQSFNTISAAGANSAVVHYGKNSPEALLTDGEYFLIDSGAQYLGGTTDDTRTVAIGVPSQEHRRVYTSVLKGHLALGNLSFPRSTTGGQLDAVARAALWKQQLSYGHGTGHGVGAYLNVHEGPNRIAPNITETFQPGMITSNEPGAYREGWGGVRIENLALVVDRGHRDGQQWLGFENLTYIPYDRALIDVVLLSGEERGQVDAYHAEVLSLVGPRLQGEELAWLQQACAAL